MKWRYSVEADLKLCSSGSGVLIHVGEAGMLHQIEKEVDVECQLARPSPASF